MNASSVTHQGAADLAGVLRQVVAMDKALRTGAPLPALSSEQSRELVLIVTDALLAQRRERVRAPV